MEYLVRGKFVVTMQPRYGTQGVIRDAAVVVSGRDIVEVGPYRDLKASYPTATVVGSSRYWVIPGFVNAHQHGKGLTDFQLGGKDDCFEISRFAADPRGALDPYLDVLYACKTMIESGITMCLHYNSSLSPKTYEADVDERLRAYRDAGMRVSFGLDIRDRNHIVYGDEEFLASLPASLRGTGGRSLQRIAHRGAGRLFPGGPPARGRTERRWRPGAAVPDTGRPPVVHGGTAARHPAGVRGARPRDPDPRAGDEVSTVVLPPRIREERGAVAGRPGLPGAAGEPGPRRVAQSRGYPDRGFHRRGGRSQPELQPAAAQRHRPADALP